MSPNLVGDRLRERFADLLLRISTRDGRDPVFVIVEHKSRADRFTVLDLLQSACFLWSDWRRTRSQEQWLPRVLPLVVHHGRKAWDAPRELRELFGTGGGGGGDVVDSDSRDLDPRFRFLLLDLGGVDHPEHRVQAIQNPLARCVLYLLMISRREDFVERLLAFGIPMLAEVWQPVGKGEWRWVVLEYIGAWIPADTDVEEVARMIGEKVHPEAERHMKTAQQVMIEKARQEGLAMGIEKGIEKGIHRGEALAVLEILAARFGSEDAALVSRVYSVSSGVGLRKLIRAATLAPSLEAFEREIDAVVDSTE